MKRFGFFPLARVNGGRTARPWVSGFLSALALQRPGHSRQTSLNPAFDTFVRATAGDSKASRPGGRRPLALCSRPSLPIRAAGSCRCRHHPCRAAPRCCPGRRCTMPKMVCWPCSDKALTLPRCSQWSFHRSARCPPRWKYASPAASTSSGGAGAREPAAVSSGARFAGSKAATPGPLLNGAPLAFRRQCLGRALPSRRAAQGEQRRGAQIPGQHPAQQRPPG